MRPFLPAVSWFSLASSWRARLLRTAHAEAGVGEDSEVSTPQCPTPGTQGSQSPRMWGTLCWGSGGTDEVIISSQGVSAGKEALEVGGGVERIASGAHPASVDSCLEVDTIC